MKEVSETLTCKRGVLMSKKSHKVKVGDVFAIEISENVYSYGQVVSLGQLSECIVIYDMTSAAHPRVEEIIKQPIIFLAHTVTTRIEDGYWPYIGTAPVPNTIKYPEYICETLKGFVVLNYKGQTVRRANQEDMETLSTLRSCSPAIVEDAVKARYGHAEWYPYLDNLLYRT